ncbi:hypothetical protein KSF_109850 [Reticulibacter mediterranei]|uniref:Uncharacterized protein n=1 Tax=Reticulibacter mediterranei TaxID=2778369 RepID=A0A8J3NAZ6_9CHLR|nr:hypothetical protein KSF_109850 [Reticulibacter mediterranei]
MQARNREDISSLHDPCASVKENTVSEAEQTSALPSEKREKSEEKAQEYEGRTSGGQFVLSS